MEPFVAKGRDWNPWIRAALLLALTALLFNLIRTGGITAYIHPRFTWFTASAGIGFLLMAGGQIARAVRDEATHLPPLRGSLYLAFALVIALGFWTKPHTFGADLAAKQGLNITNRTGLKQAPAAPSTSSPPVATGPGGPTSGAPGSPAPAPTSPAPTNPSSSPAPGGPVAQPGGGGTGAGVPALGGPPAGVPADAPPGALPVGTPNPDKLTINGNTIVVTHENFVAWMTELYASPAKYGGKRITMEGFAFYPPDVDEAEFALTRLVVACHVAHAYPDGLLAAIPGKPRPAQDGWHRIEGPLELINYRGTPALKIKVEKLTAIAQPTDPYVYP